MQFLFVGAISFCCEITNDSVSNANINFWGWRRVLGFLGFDILNFPNTMYIDSLEMIFFTLSYFLFVYHSCCQKN